jgi:hypothetical protein
MEKLPPYKTPLAQCDVQDKRALEAYRAKRAEWLTWLRYDEHHAISDALSGMVWADVRFRTLARIGELESAGGLHNQLVMEGKSLWLITSLIQ